MPALTREERETCIILNELGEITIWSVSPIYQKKLRRRLGAPTRIDGECWTWARVLADTSLPLPSKKRPKREFTPEQREAARLRLSAARKSLTGTGTNGPTAP